MQYARLILILAFALPPAAALPANPEDSSARPAYEHIRGVLKKVGRSGGDLTIEDAKGKKTRVILPAYVWVKKRISLSELAVDDSVHVLFSPSEGQDVIGTIQIDPRSSGSPHPVWNGKPITERPRRYQGWVSGLDVASRRLAIERIDGEIRWFSVAKGAFIIVIGLPDILREGDSAMITFEGPAESGKPALVQAESPKVRGRR